MMSAGAADKRAVFSSRLEILLAEMHGEER